MPTPAAFAATAALLGDPARAAMLQALLSGEALTAGELARVAGIGAPGRQRAPVAAGGGRAAVRPPPGPPPLPPPGLGGGGGGDRDAGRPRPRPVARRAGSGRTATPSAPSRLCYDHLAGRLGVALHAALVGRAWIAPADGGWAATAAGEAGLDGLGVDLDAARRARRFACDCMDWSERRPHLAGGLGREIAACCLRRRWLGRLPPEAPGATRSPAAASSLTPEGARRLGEALRRPRGVRIGFPPPRGCCWRWWSTRASASSTAPRSAWWGRNSPPTSAPAPACSAPRTAPSSSRSAWRRSRWGWRWTGSGRG